MLQKEGMVAEKDLMTMSRKEARTLHIIHQALDKKITQGEAAAIHCLSDRQRRRLMSRTRTEGNEGICRRSRGKTSNHCIPRMIKEKALRLFKERYADFNIFHATEKLAEVHRITMNDETLRLWLNEAKIPYKKRRAKKHRQWREPKPHFGELAQIDRSYLTGLRAGDRFACLWDTSMTRPTPCMAVFMTMRAPFQLWTV